MSSFPPVISKLLPLPYHNIDNDLIIPGRFLKSNNKMRWAKGLFATWRYLPDGRSDPQFALNRPEHRGAQILLTGDNFGCGSAQEYAAWAIIENGFRVVISTSFSDQFRENALKNRLLPVVLDKEAHIHLFRMVAADPHVVVMVDLVSQTVTMEDERVATFPLDRFSKFCLLQGIDNLGILAHQPDPRSARDRRLNN